MSLISLAVHQSLQQFGPTRPISGLNFCRAWSLSKLFANVAEIIHVLSTYIPTCWTWNIVCLTVMWNTLAAMGTIKENNYFYCKFLTSIFIFKIKIIYGVELSYAPVNWPPSSPPNPDLWGVVDSEAIEQFVYFDIVATVLEKFEVGLPRQLWLRGNCHCLTSLL